MSLANWFRQATAPKTSARLEGLIFRVAQYLNSKPFNNAFAPKIVGKALSESELAAMTALSILEKLGITKHHFGVYCSKTDVPLTNYDDLKEMPESWYCDNCDADHSVSDHTCKIEIYFTVDRKKLSTFIAKASAA